jgi:hypothetical protein
MYHHYLLNMQPEDVILEQEGSIIMMSLHITYQSISVPMTQDDQIWWKMGEWERGGT